MAESVQWGPRCPAWRRVLIAALAALSWSAPLTATPNVVASIAPVHSLAAAVMGDLGAPKQIVRGYGSPHAHQMRPSDAANLRDADLILWIGPSLETFLQRPLAERDASARVVTLSAVPGLALLGSPGSGIRRDHAHAVGEARANDPHIWLSPFNAKLMAGAIAKELATLDAKNARYYQANFDRLSKDIEAMQTRIASRLAPVRNTPFVVFHDAFQYFENSFGLNAVGAVTLGPDHIPSARRIKALREEIASSGARCVFREPQFESGLIQVLLEDSSARAGVLDPLGTEVTPGPGAYFELMDANTNALLECLNQ